MPCGGMDGVAGCGEIDEGVGDGAAAAFRESAEGDGGELVVPVVGDQVAECCRSEALVAPNVVGTVDGRRGVAGAAGAVVGSVVSSLRGSLGAVTVGGVSVRPTSPACAPGAGRVLEPALRHVDSDPEALVRAMAVELLGAFVRTELRAVGAVRTGRGCGPSPAVRRESGAGSPPAGPSSPAPPHTDAPSPGSGAGSDQALHRTGRVRSA